MCGRYTLISGRDEYLRYFGIEEFEEFEDRPRYNVAPSQWLPVVVGAAKRKLLCAAWGLTPPWAGKGGRPAPRLINVRTESLGTNAWYRRLVQSGRCVIPADGFYEWSAMANGKVPYYFALEGERVFGFAGLWAESVMPATGEIVRAFAILTTDATGVVAEIHGRAPVTVLCAETANWLTAGSIQGLPELLARQASLPWRSRRVDSRVNNPKFDDVACLNNS